MRKALFIAVTVMAVGLLATSCDTTGNPAGAGSAPGPIDPTSHFTVNLDGNPSAAIGAGFNVIDTGPTVSIVNGLPAGTKAMVYLGNLDNEACTSALTLDDFKRRVDALDGNPKVYGFYISDEPHPGTCPSAVADIRLRADYIHAHAPGTKVFIGVENSSRSCTSANPDCEFEALKPANTHVDLIGIISYPCHVGAPCDLKKIDGKVGLARTAGVPEWAMVPVFQTFGQGGGYYRLPSAAELTSILDRWHALLPTPQLDYSYTWGTQPSQPQGLINTPALEQVIKDYNLTH